MDEDRGKVKTRGLADRVGARATEGCSRSGGRREKPFKIMPRCGGKGLRPGAGEMAGGKSKPAAFEAKALAADD